MRIHESSTQLVARPDVKLGGGGSAGKAAPSAGAKDAATVSFSPRAQELAESAVRVSQLKAQIADGSYQVNAKAVADKLMGPP